MDLAQQNRKLILKRNFNTSISQPNIFAKITTRRHGWVAKRIFVIKAKRFISVILKHLNSRVFQKFCKSYPIKKNFSSFPQFSRVVHYSKSQVNHKILPLPRSWGFLKPYQQWRSWNFQGVRFRKRGRSETCPYSSGRYVHHPLHPVAQNLLPN